MDKRRDRIDTFKIINGNYNVRADLFSESEEGSIRGHYKKFLKQLDLMLESVHIAVEDGTLCMKIALPALCSIISELKRLFNEMQP